MTQRKVTPFAGVWIEIMSALGLEVDDLVTPFAGVWIEMGIPRIPAERLKVTPFAGVWIERHLHGRNRNLSGSHSLCGSVD